MFDPDSFASFSTRAVHAGLCPDPATGAIVTPIHQTTTYVLDGVGRDRGYTYTRTHNPTVAALEAHLGALEDAPPAVCFGTGLAAIASTIVAHCDGGDHVVCGAAVYGGTYRLLDRVLARFGVETSFVDATVPDAIADAIRPRTKLVLAETPANPTLVLTDIAAVAARCHDRGVPLAIDNTFLTAALQQPLALGADLTITSTTKYVEGHNTTVGGAVVTRDPERLERLRFVRNALGTTIAPFDAWLTLRGSQTLPLRLDAHSRSALRVASWLDLCAPVASVVHPDLPSFPQRELARRQHRAGGGTLGFELRGGFDEAVRFLGALRLCALAESLGAVQTLVTHPASMTHAAIPRDDRLRLGITDGWIRLSVGLEDPDDLIADLAAALAVST
ncbi:MAG: PLP-dependent transferase [Myxococcota bacterium]